ncbi:DUF1871 family protein [Bacillus smithii]|uniref:DUF1871 domain-containing protein n=1 Tax=Bacillus smithii 7_3_47FAA TaxID=665952 RepID=G9QLP6_9BACI|nr:DUF1871 family protein [Bacillus smithii]AKP48255.1 DUF1871 domain-containing protein [Bacillus smithii]EHL77914.1 hypothetical protein HMPREF1015_03139 [Bacillus smithii 7_3_47FAA]MED4882401.1 DUF1871 family protein [Bacillus smithii]MED4927555.1 DUF1871 family protein [Bacillus smithii]
MNPIAKTNLQLADILMGWDPFRIGAGQYDTEMADIIQAVHETDNLETLVRKIRAIFELSFEELLPREEIEPIASALLAVKENSSCDLPFQR